MLINDGISRLTHFSYHPEMSPHVGHNGILFVGECTHFKDDFFADKSDAFMNWYNEPLPNHFEGLSDSEWRLSIAYYGIRQTIMRNYDKYAKPEPPIPFDEISKFLSEIIDKSYDKYINYSHMYSRITVGGMEDMLKIYKYHASIILRDALKAGSRERWRDCSYSVYYQRPNLTSGGFQEIMSDEDKFAFEIFQQTIDYVSPYLIMVLSAKASESIKSQAGGNLPDNIHFFDSEFPSIWSDDKRKEFANAVDDIVYHWSQDFKREWLELSGTEDEYFISVIDEALLSKSSKYDARPLEALDDIIQTNAKFLSKLNPYSIKNSQFIKRDDFDIQTSNSFLKHHSYDYQSNEDDFYDPFKHINNPTPWFNAYPIHIDSDETFPLFLAICQSRENFETVLDKMLEQCKKIAAKFPNNMLIKRNVVLLTTVWDEYIFYNYKSKFKYYERNHFIHFICACINEYEINIKYASNEKRERDIVSYEETLTNVKAKFWYHFEDLMRTFKLGTYTQEQFKPSRHKQRILIRKLENKYVDFFFNEYQSDKDELNINVLIGSKNNAIIKKLISYWKNNDSKMHELESQYKGCTFVRVLQLSSNDKTYYFDLEHFDNLKDCLKITKAKKVANLNKNESRDYLLQQGVNEKDWRIAQFMSGKYDSWSISECLKIELPPIDMNPFCGKDRKTADENLKNLLKKQIDTIKNI